MQIFAGLFVAFILIVAAYGFALKMSVNRARWRTGFPHPSEMSAEVRHQTYRLRELREEIERTVRAHKNLPEIQVIGQEALDISRDVIAKVVEFASQRENVRRVYTKGGMTDEDLARLEMKMENAGSVSEKESIAQTISNYQKARGQLEQAEGKFGDLDQQVDEAEAALSEIHSRMMLMTALGSTEKGDDLRETLSRLRSLSTTLDEVDSSLISGVGRE